MGKANVPGLPGIVRLAGQQVPAVSLEGTGSLTARIRVLNEQPDDDAPAGTGAGGWTVNGGVAVSLVDVLTADNQFAVGVPAARFFDSEAELAAFTPSEDFEDVLLIVRDSSKRGYSLFAVVETSPGSGIYVLVPVTPNVPSVELTTYTPSAHDIPVGTDVVLGSAGLAPTLAREFAAPGRDPGSPFAALWSYSAGVLSSVPAGRARLTGGFSCNDIDAAVFELVLQRQPAGGGAFVDFRRLWSQDLIAVLTAATSRWTITIPPLAFPVVAGDSFRLVLRHFSGQDRTFDIESVTVLINSIASQS